MAREMTDKSGKSLVGFWSRAAEKGWVNKSTAANYRAACQRVLEVENDWETVDVSEIEVEEMFQRFQNLRGGDYSPKSLEAFRSRFGKAVEIYLEWAENPSGWKFPTTTRRKRVEAPPSVDAERGDQVGGVQQYRMSPADGMIVYPFPLRDDLLVQLMLPRDLTTEEAKRLMAFVNALAIGGSKGD